jgi:hypothetical protein
LLAKREVLCLFSFFYNFFSFFSFFKSKIMNKNFTKTIVNIFLLPFCMSVSMSTAFAQSVWSTGSAWLTSGNWAPAGAPAVGAIAQFGATNTSSAGINMNGAKNNGANNQAVGAIQILSTRAGTTSVGNSSTAAAGTLTLNGATVGADMNVIIANESAQNFNINKNFGTGTAALEVALGNATNNLVNIASTGNVTINIPVKGANPLTLAGAGTGKLVLTGLNTYTGLTTIAATSAATLQLSTANCLPATNNVSVLGGKLKISANQTINDLTINGGSVIVDDGFTLTINGTLTLTDGKITLGTGNVIAAAVSGGDAGSFVITGGTGTLTIKNVSSATTFHVGASGTLYHPATLTPTTATDIAVRVSGSFTSPVLDPAKVTAVEWNITPTTPSSTVFALKHDLGVTAPAAGTAVIGHFTGGAWNEVDVTGAAYNAASRTYSGTCSTFSPFGGGVAGGFSAPAPIELTKFEVKKNQKSALLVWETASEKDNAFFNIQHSANGSDFNNIGEVKGQGTRTVATSYNFEHSTPSAGINYYRLKQVDYDGKSTFSAVRSAIFVKGGLVVKSTLVQDVVNITTTDETTTLNIFNVAGQQVINIEARGEQSINVGHLPAGLYFIRTVTGDVARFIKE